ncbi:DNA helicase [Trifolium repens]|nr:DNA helicase [Trifolium repens]
MVEKLDLSHKNLRGNVTLMSKLKNLKLLDLSNNNFGGLIPLAFGTLSELEVLDLSSNKFEGSIPSQFGGLRSLKSLNLSNNLLVGEFPIELHGLNKLQDLQLSMLFRKLTASWVRALAAEYPDIPSCEFFEQYDRAGSAAVLPPGVYTLQVFGILVLLVAWLILVLSADSGMLDFKFSNGVECSVLDAVL